MGQINTFSDLLSHIEVEHENYIDFLLDEFMELSELEKARIKGEIDAYSSFIYLLTEIIHTRGFGYE